MKKVLIIDDEPAIIEMYKIKLESAGYEVMTSSSGTEGIEVARKWRPQIILLDIIMPQVNGFDVLKTLKESPETKSIPVFMTTNLPEHTSGEKARALGAAQYLVKAEYEPGMIVDVIDRYLNQGQKAETAPQ